MPGLERRSQEVFGALTFRQFPAIDTLPDTARSLFGGDAFSTESWYRTVAAAAVPERAHPIFLLVEEAGRPLALLPLMESADSFSSLTTPYSCFWHPLFSSALNPPTLTEVGKNLGHFLRRHPIIRLDALDADAPWVVPFVGGLRRAGLHALWFDHFGNWHGNVAGLDWAAYLACRPGRLRETIRRRTKRLLQEGAAFTLIDGTIGLDDALEAYAQVYERSWKEAEPFENFNPALMRACAADGSLRLALLHQQGTPIAVQFWMVRDGWAGVQKLAHDETAKASAPGTVLTGLVIRHLLEHERIRELDFGRGDDAYKQDWTGLRRQREGVLLVDPFSPRGFLAFSGHRLGGLRRRFFC